MTALTVEDLNNITSEIDESRTAWLSSSASQIFFMQLGFLLYEVGYVRPLWATSIITKNIEDTFVGILTFLCFGYTLSTSTPSIFGIISYPKQVFLLNTHESEYDTIFISATFASTCATIISGGVLERMKNKAYIIYCFFTILVNYSFVAHWVWNEEGFLSKLGFVDAAGSIVVHATGGCASLVAIYYLGPRQGVVDSDGKLLPIRGASQPAMNAMGAFILWFGWYAFNVSSPIAAGKQIGHALGSTALVTLIAPSCSAVAASLLMYRGFAKTRFDDLLSSVLAGLVAITAGCSTVSIWSAALIGLFAAPFYFIMSNIVREKWQIDDPLQIIPVHLMCGLYACFMEGIFANDTFGEPGLIYGGFKHFGIQCLGIVVVVAFNLLISLFVYGIVMNKCIFRNKSIKVSILDTYLGTQLYHLNYDMALKEVLKCETNIAKQMLFLFHEYCVGQFNDEQLDFLVCIYILRDLMKMKDVKDDHDLLAKYHIAIINTYLAEDGVMCINIESAHRARILTFKKRLEMEMKQRKISISTTKTTVTSTGSTERPDFDLQINGATFSKGNKHNKDFPILGLRAQDLNGYSRPAFSWLSMDDTIFENAFKSVWQMMLPVFCSFLNKFDKKRDILKYRVELPFCVEIDWMLNWEKELVKTTLHDQRLGNVVKSKFDEINNMDNEELLTFGPSIDQQRKTPSNSVQLIIAPPPTKSLDVGDNDVSKAKSTNDTTTEVAKISTLSFIIE